MFRKISDFSPSWAYETEATLKCLRVIPESQADTKFNPKVMTLRELAWHLAQAIGGLLNRYGLSEEAPDYKTNPPGSIEELIAIYEKVAQKAGEAIASQWKDEDLLENVDFFGMQLARGQILGMMIMHQSHHRGQLTVLLRLAGAIAPGVYGPSQEESEAMRAASRA